MSNRRQSFRKAPPLRSPPTARLRRVATILQAWGPVRTFPWRQNPPGPFRMLVAEILLSRTRAQTVAAVAEQLWHRYPGADDLATADIDQIARLIAPLGLAKRASMLVKTAKAVTAHGGVPADREALVRLPGVGRYVADAVCLFAFGLPTIPIDAVIGRVLRRVFGYPNFGPAYADRSLWTSVQPLALHGSAQRTVAAILDLGALICLPDRPRCPDCPLEAVCNHANGLVTSLAAPPVVDCTTPPQLNNHAVTATTPSTL